MSDWLNMVTINVARNGTTSHTVDPSTTGTVVAGTAFTPTAGRLLLCLVEGAVTSTTPSGWTLPTNGSAVNNTGLYVFTKAAAGSDTISTTHNGSNYPIVVTFFEFASGSTFVKAATATSVTLAGANPTISSLTGTNWLGAAKATGVSSGLTYTSSTWSTGTPTPVEIIDTGVAFATTDGYGFTVAEANASTATSWTPTGTMTGSGLLNCEALTFAVNVATGATNFNGTSTLTGTDTVTTAGVVGSVAGSTLSGTGTTTLVGVRGTVAAVSLTGTGSGTTAGVVGTVATSSLSGSGSITTAGVVGKTATATLAGTGTLSAAGIVSLSSSVTIVGTGALTAAGSVVAGGSASASLAGAGSVTVSGVVGLFGSAALTGTATIVTAGGGNVTATGTLTGSGTITTTGVVGKVTTASIAGTGSLTASGTVVAGGVGTAMVLGVATITTVGVVGVRSAATLTGVGAISPVFTPYGARDISLTGVPLASRWQTSETVRWWPRPTRTNLITANSLPTTTTGWALGGLNPQVTTMSDGTPCVEHTCTGLATPYIFSPVVTGPITAGVTYVLFAMVEAVGDVSAARWHIRAHGRVGNTYYAQGALLTQVVSSPQMVAVTFVAPAGVADSNLDLSFIRSSIPAAGVKMRMGEVMIERADTASSYSGDGTVTPDPSALPATLDGRWATTPLPTRWSTTPEET